METTSINITAAATLLRNYNNDVDRIRRERSELIQGKADDQTIGKWDRKIGEAMAKASAVTDTLLVLGILDKVKREL